MESSIRLVVKTPNQRFKDIHIDCDLGWTVKKLKDYLANVHPTNPVKFHFCNVDIRLLCRQIFDGLFRPTYQFLFRGSDYIT